MSSESIKCFRLLTKRSNARSTSGLLTALDGELFHYKRPKRPDVAEREAHELRRAEAATHSVRGIRPIRVRTYLPEQGLLVTEYIGRSERLFNYLWNRSRCWEWRGFSPLTPAEVGTRLGRWLRAYHTSTLSYTSQPTQFIDILAKSAQAKLRSLSERAPWFLHPKIVNCLRIYVENAANRSRHWDVRNIVQIHGDMDLANILVAPDGTLFIVDFADTQPGIACQDFTRLWHGVWTIAQLSSRRKRLIEPCLQTLITEYGESEAIFKSPLFLFLRCRNAIGNILTAVTIGKRIGPAASRVSKVNRKWLEMVDWQNETSNSR